MKVLIVGAGPTGLTAAVELARQGIVPTVVERRERPSELSRAVGVLKSSIDILGPSGAAQAIVDEAVVFSAFAIHQGARRVASFPLNFDDTTRLWGLPEDRTEHHIRSALERYGGRVHYGAPLDSFEQDGEGIRARFGDEEDRFDYLLGADGTHSTVRHGLGLPYHGFDLPDDWSIADVTSPDWPDPTTFQGFILSEGRVVIVAPMAPMRFRVIASTADALAALPVPMNVTEVRRTGTFRIAVRQVPRYGDGRVFLAGDAAHSHSPAGGRGMNLGIADGAEFAGRLVAGTLDGYSASRHAAGRHVIRFTERMRRQVQSTNPFVRQGSLATMRLLSAVPPLARAAMRRFVSG